MQINGGDISAALKHLSISAVGGLKTLLDLIRQLGDKRGILSESKFTDIVKKYKYSAEEQRRYTATEWRDVFASAGLRVEIMEQLDIIVDTGLVGKRVLSK